jgi:hypothetical protein
MNEMSYKEWIDNASEISFLNRPFIDGKGIPARSGRTFASVDLAIGEPHAEVNSCGEEAIAPVRRSLRNTDGGASRSSALKPRQRCRGSSVALDFRRTRLPDTLRTQIGITCP